MSYQTIALPSSSVGSQTYLGVHRFGPSGGKKVYLQAGLHADEYPGLLVAQHLIGHLAQLEQQHLLRAEIVVVPFANPIGLRQRTFGHVTGRCDWHTGQNFNRGMALDSAELIQTLAPNLSEDGAHNSRLLRTAMLQQVAQRTGQMEIATLHQTLLGLSIDADLVIDLHCDDVALPHLFYAHHQPEIGLQLACSLGYDICLEEDVRGTVAFDGSHTQPWVLVQAEFPDHPFASPCFAATIELRGRTDVSTELAQQDSQGIVHFLAGQGLIAASDYQPPACTPQQHGVDQVSLILASHSGLVTYKRALGEWLAADDLIAEIVLLDQPIPQTIEVRSPSAGRLFSQTNHFFSAPGQVIAMVATREAQNQPGTQLAY
ncbi:succinylglutamate desuccinylase/aspartoacylase family protein [Reinekea sp.]|uniref:succinylglutamate desuccinylase/aspartoacylase family protein n=1 Tax=Reinekea sp. TaxID=1970455 RepID=UPI002A834450|nr:succinylglutamate desuccinylase/aspartoacylase family protein [Reinekea sp.]